ncbi:hypothetical protein [Sporosarcina globispora]|nr:hypothetical protein [Sporosarcina globispora]
MYKVYALDFDQTRVINIIDTIEEIKEWAEINGYTITKIINRKSKQIIKL